jgi:hypothetical protein
MKKWLTMVMMFLFGIGVTGLTGCDTAEDAGHEAGEAMEDVGDEVEEAADNVD